MKSSWTEIYGNEPLALLLRRNECDIYRSAVRKRAATSSNVLFLVSGTFL